METKILKCLMLVCLATGVSSAFAQSSVYEELRPGSCSKMSKNPRCWEGQDNTKPPRPTMCRAKSSCEMIKSVHQDGWGLYHCKAADGHRFSCHKLVEQFGTNLEGLAVKITTPYSDGCHMRGACGSQACVPSYGTASLDQSCQ